MVRIYVNVLVRGSARVLALCDADAIGNVYEDGDVCLDLDRYSSFYVGELKDVEEVKDLLENQRFSSINAVGQNAIALLIAQGLCDEEDVLSIGGVKHVQIYFV